MDYLLEPVRRELRARWALCADDVSKSNSASTSPNKSANKSKNKNKNKARVVWVDFNSAACALPDVDVTRVSMLDSPQALDALPDVQWDGLCVVVQAAWFAPQYLFAAAHRLLREEAPLLLCTLGPDTLQQICDAWRCVDELAHVHPFADMHLIGDQLAQSGFVRTVLDVDRVRVNYPRLALHDDLRAAGLVNVLTERRKTLTGKNRFARYCRALDELRNARGELTVDYELVYASAFKARAKAASINIAAPEWKK